MEINYMPDAKYYHQKEWEAGKRIVYEGMTYSNSKGKKYRVIETSPAGDLDVLVATTCPFGYCNIWIPKLMLFI